MSAIVQGERVTIPLAAKPASVLRKTTDDGTSIYHMYGVGASELEDMAGDKVHRSALEDLCMVEPGLACSIDHIRDDDHYFGPLVKSPILAEHPPGTFGALSSNLPFAVVEVEVMASQHSERAQRIVRRVEEGARYGFSVQSPRITERAMRKSKDGQRVAWDIFHVLPPDEFAVTYNPCNPSCWADILAKSLSGALTGDPVEDEYRMAHGQDWDDETAILFHHLSEVGTILKRRGLSLKEVMGEAPL